MKKVFVAVTLLALIPLSGCGSSTNSEASKVTNPEIQQKITNPEIQQKNCQLVYDWFDYRRDPALKNYFYSQENTYDYYAAIEDRVFSKLISGDSSYDTLLQIRTMEYDSNFLNTPPLGIAVSSDNFEQYRKTGDLTLDSFIPDDQQWVTINALQAACSKFTANEYAEEFASSLLIEN